MTDKEEKLADPPTMAELTAEIARLASLIAEKGGRVERAKDALEAARENFVAVSGGLSSLQMQLENAMADLQSRSPRGTRWAAQNEEKQEQTPGPSLTAGMNDQASQTTRQQITTKPVKAANVRDALEKSGLLG